MILSTKNVHQSNVVICHGSNAQTLLVPYSTRDLVPPYNVSNNFMNSLEFHYPIK